jgi:acyl-CoA thioester hydrolase
MKEVELKRRARHIIDIQARFNDYDMFRHLNNGAYLQYMDLAKARYLAEVLGLSTLSPDRIAMVIVNINCDFYQPTLPEEPIAVSTSVIAMGDRSITLEQAVYNPETSSIKAVSHTIMSTFDVATSKSTLLPDDVRDAITRYDSL